ncbi:chromosomal replication initiator DnaA [Sphingomonas ginkgonis]|uniref:Chromosomal replication initiator DnaA n=1 Tax=Sphingomonas ginkgonis TaxID=2315330 RepID=A0A3R9Y6H1_9SPHN|nr:DnaA/Hda family protein [Sphingomonas ginkgonis]RST31203.1 chromosomal replication initiator DnaA [Sphingomonas ginkgonis]
MRISDQIALPLDWPQGCDDERFIVGDANREAYDHFRRWSTWPVRSTILVGPRRSGRSLLARAFVARVGGRLFDQAERQDEELLFHAWNEAQESKRPLVLVADQPPPAWGILLPDLRTRLAITPVATIYPPDDELFAALIQRLFADRGLYMPADALRYVVTRVTRTYLTAERVVEAIDRFAIAERARLTLPTVRRALVAAGLIGEEGE